MKIYLLLYVNSNVPVMAFENKEDCLKKKLRMERKEERLIKNRLLPKEKKSLLYYKVIDLKRRKK